MNFLNQMMVYNLAKDTVQRINDDMDAVYNSTAFKEKRRADYEKEKEKQESREEHKAKIEKLKKHGFNPLRALSVVKAFEKWARGITVDTEFAMQKYLDAREDMIKKYAEGQRGAQHEEALRKLNDAKLDFMTSTGVRGWENIKEEFDNNLKKYFLQMERVVDAKIENEVGVQIAEMFKDDELAKAVLQEVPEYRLAFSWGAAKDNMLGKKEGSASASKKENKKNKKKKKKKK